MIKPYTFDLPAGRVCEVVGFLYEADSPVDLGQDMIEVQLANGLTIDAGWYPEGDPAGSYVVKAWHPHGIEFPSESFSTVSAAAAAISKWVASDPQVLSAHSMPTRPQL